MSLETDKQAFALQQALDSWPQRRKNYETIGGTFLLGSLICLALAAFAIAPIITIPLAVLGIAVGLATHWLVDYKEKALEAQKSPLAIKQKATNPNDAESKRLQSHYNILTRGLRQLWSNDSSMEAAPSNARKRPSTTITAEEQGVVITSTSPKRTMQNREEPADLSPSVYPRW